ncbi:hypothetical protein BLA29_012670, partial [Euroglyphus maynei]
MDNQQQQHNRKTTSSSLIKNQKLRSKSYTDLHSNGGKKRSLKNFKQKKTPISLPMKKSQSRSESPKLTESMKEMTKVLQFCPVSNSEEMKRLRSIEKLANRTSSSSLRHKEHRTKSISKQQSLQRKPSTEHNLCEREQSTACELSRSKMSLV